MGHHLCGVEMEPLILCSLPQRVAFLRCAGPQAQCVVTPNLLSFFDPRLLAAQQGAPALAKWL